MARKIISLAVLLVLPVSIFSASILFYFPGANLSQKLAIWPLVLALADKGHNVTFLSPQPKTPTTHSNLTDISPKPLQDILASFYNADRFANREAGLDKTFDYPGAISMLCKVVMDNRHSDPHISALLSKDSHYDLVIVNSLLSECGFYIAKMFNAKTIHYAPGTYVPFVYETYGVSLDAAWLPDYHYTFYNIPLTFVDRIYTTWGLLYWQYVRAYKMTPVLQEISKPLFKEGEYIPTLYELEQQVSVSLVNSHVSADFARTMPPFFVAVGGMGCWEVAKDVPENFRKILDSANHGVVLITFGSTVLLNQVSKRHQQMFFHLIDRFPNVKFLMRWKGTMPEFVKETPANLILSDWLPQKEILSHPNVKAFVTHGGISSMHEATYHGVPLIVLPLFADQDYNAYRVEAQQIGVRVEIKGMTNETMVQALDNVLSSSRYKENMERKSAMFRDRPQSPVETALFWTEFALRHNHTVDSLRPQNQHLSVWQIQLWDVVLFCVFGTLLSLWLAVKCVVSLGRLTQNACRRLLNKQKME